MECKKCKGAIPDGAPFCPWCGMRQEKPKGVKTRTNGTGTAFRRGKGWTAEVTLGYKEDGKRIKRTKDGFRTKAEAINYCAVLLETPRQKRTPLLCNYWDLYYGRQMEDLSESKRTSYKIAWNKLQAISRMPVNKITVADLQEAISSTCKTFYPARDAKQLLSNLFKLAAADGWCNKDLPAMIKLPKNNENERMPFTDEEQRLLWALYDRGDTNVHIPLIMIYTGMMTGEMLKLTVSMIDLPNREIVGVGIKTDTRKKSAVFLPDDICPVLEDAMALAGEDGRLYPMSDMAFYKRYYRALKAAGITRKLTPYSCRHTTATIHAVDEHTPPQVLQKIMRWSSTKMMDRYVHPDDSDAHEAANTMKRPDRDPENCV